MTNLSKTTVLDFTGLTSKTAALYFDYVIPLHLFEWDILKPEVFNQILPPFLLDPRPEKGFVRDYLEVLKQHLIMFVYFKEQGIKGKEFDRELSNHCLKVKAFQKKYKLQNTPMLQRDRNDAFFGQGEDGIFMILANAKLVDVSKASWEQICEFRKDKSAVAKFRKLKQFLSQNYATKDKNFIEADLVLRLDDYANTVKDWGFETKTSTISMLLSSKSLATTIGGTVASGLFGATTLAAVTAAGGACVEVGKISLYLAKRQYGSLKLRRDDPLVYIIDAKESLETHGKKSKA